MRKDFIDWNDHIQDFIKIKLEEPHVLAELVRRESEFAQKRQTEHKIQTLRKKYDLLTKEFRTQQKESENLIQFKKSLQKEVTQLNGHIIRLEVDVEKQVHEPVMQPQKEKEEPTRYSINSDSFATKKQEELAVLLSQHASTRQSISTEIADLIARRVELTEALENSAGILQEQINKKQAQEQFKKVEESLTNLQMRLQRQKERRKKLSNQISEADYRASQLRKSRQSYQINAGEINKKLQSFVKESKKMLMSSQGRSSRKYQQFLKKYRTFSKEEEEQIRRQYNLTFRESQGGGLQFSLFPFPIEPKTDKYEDMVIQIMKKFNNKSFTTQQFNDLEKKVTQVATYYTQLLETDASLTTQMQGLRENLKRKIKEVEAVKMSPEFSRKST